MSNNNNNNNKMQNSTKRLQELTGIVGESDPLGIIHI